MKRYVEQHLEQVSKVGGDGLIAALVLVEREGARLSRDEMVAMVFLLLLAGHETTTHLISGSVFELAKNPALRDWLAEDWSRADLAIEEFLRFVSPVQVSKPRYVRRDVDFGGVQLKHGDQIMAMLMAANFDPAANTSPEALDLERKPNQHMAFGTGIHFCLGYQLARLEGRCALEALYKRWPKLALAVEPGEIRWRSRPGIRAIISLPVVATPNGGAPTSASGGDADMPSQADDVRLTRHWRGRSQLAPVSRTKRRAPKPDVGNLTKSGSSRTSIRPASRPRP
jgi:cytochrome P450 PksS